MTRRWHALSPQYRHVALASAAVAIMLLAWTFVWVPLAESRASLRENAAAQATTLTWMRPASARLRALGTTSAPTVPPTGSLLARVDESARGSGLGGSVVSVEPVDAHRVRIQMSGADFDVVIAWLERITASGLRVDDLSIQRASGPGRVDARVGFRDGVP